MHLITLFFYIFICSLTTVIKADNPYFIDFKFILNQSDTGKSTEIFKDKLEKVLNINEKKKIQEEEKQIIQQKKLFLQRIIKK